MRSVLKDLNETAGIRGSMVVTTDGMVVAARLGRSLDEERVAAMASGVVTSIARAVGSRGLGTFYRATLASTQGRMVFMDAGIAHLVVVLDGDIQLGPTLIEIQSAARRIRELSRIRSE